MNASKRSPGLLEGLGIWALALIGLALITPVSVVQGAAGYKEVKRDYVTAPSAPASQSAEEMNAKSGGCESCHTDTDQKTMHPNPAVKLGCTDCHGGDASASYSGSGGSPEEAEFLAVMERAHVLPRFPDAWHYPSSANPEQSYTLLNQESPEFVRFVNPSDYRIAREACGACHLPIIEAAERSLMATSAMLWGGASYNNGILPYKRYILGESYTREGDPAMIPGAHKTYP